MKLRHMWMIRNGSRSNLEIKIKLLNECFETRPFVHPDVSKESKIIRKIQEASRVAPKGIRNSTGVRFSPSFDCKVEEKLGEKMWNTEGRKWKAARSRTFESFESISILSLLPIAIQQSKRVFFLSLLSPLLDSTTRRSSNNSRPPTLRNVDCHSVAHGKRERREGKNVKLLG